MFESFSRVSVRTYASELASQIRLPFRQSTWRGHAGAWQGTGIGSSIDFQDHRQYLPGDDPRYINWQAYARTGNYSMKLYREEVSPQLDVVLDVSASMKVSEEKARRVLELFYFITSSALKAGAALRCYQVLPGKVEYITMDALQSDQWQVLERDSAEHSKAIEGEVPSFDLVPWRSHSMRVIVSDLLFAGSPDVVLDSLSASKSQLLLFCPWCEVEATPGWTGNVELRNCETGAIEKLRFTDRELSAYQQRYRQHFNLWQESCAKRHYGFARVGAEDSLQAELLKEPLESGLVELWN